jgi:SAM-dependent methyltransferase
MTAFRDALVALAPGERDAWLDRTLVLDELPADEPLPRHCVPYLPCPVDTILRAIEHANITAADTFVDVGAGTGRAAALVHLATGATVIGVEIQHRLVTAARELAVRLAAPLTFVEGDAADVLPRGTVYFLYCPFSGDRLGALLARLAALRPIRLCCVDLPLPPCPWLRLVHADHDLAVYAG